MNKDTDKEFYKFLFLLNIFVITGSVRPTVDLDCLILFRGNVKRGSSVMQKIPNSYFVGLDTKDTLMDVWLVKPGKPVEDMYISRLLTQSN